MKKLCKEQLLEMIELRKQGVSVKDLAAKYDVSYEYASHLTSGAAMEKENDNKVWDAETRATWRYLQALVRHIAKLAGR